MSDLRWSTTLVSALAFTAFACGSSADGGDDGASGSPSGTGGSAGQSDAGKAGGAAGAGGSRATGGGPGSGGASGAGASRGTGGGGTGGAAGSGGRDAGDAGGPPPVVGSCSSLGASGTWETITPPGVKNTQAIALDPFNVGTLWLGASPTGNLGAGLGGVFKSTDCGATWGHVNTGTNGTKVDQPAIWSLAVDPAAPGVIYVIGAYGPLGLWKSTNGGVDWTQTLPGGGNVANAVGNNPSNPPFIGSVSMDPNDHLHLVVGTHDNCTGQYAPACGAETTDGGATWSLFTTPFLKGWAEQTGPYVLDASSWLYATLFDGFWLTTDRGATWKSAAPSGVNGATGGEYTHRPIWQGSDGTYYLPSYNKGGLMRSTDGRTWSLIAGSPSGSYELGFAVGGGHVYLGDRNGLTYDVAADVGTMTWTSLPKSPASANEGAVFLEYDDAHHVLYSSNFEGGLWRMVTP